MGGTHGKLQFCWECNVAGASKECPNCVRLFHSNCVSPGISKNANWSCAVCTKLKEFENTDKSKTLNMLPILISYVMKTDLFDSFKGSLVEASQSGIENVNSISEAIKLAHDQDFIQAYRSFDAFLIDVQWILNSYSMLFKGDGRKREMAKNLMKLIEDEIKGLKMCTECYLNASQYPDRWFAMVCENPHLLITTKLGTRSAQWPAKLMSINGQKVNVRFFGDHKNAEISATKCFLNLNEKSKKKSSVGPMYRAALKESNLYIENIRTTFGSYNHAEPGTPFDPALLTQYISQMISVQVKSRNPQTKSTEADESFDSDLEIVSVSDSDEEPTEISPDESRGQLSSHLTQYDVNSKEMERGEKNSENDINVAEKRVRFNEKVCIQYIDNQRDALESDKGDDDNEGSPDDNDGDDNDGESSDDNDVDNNDNGPSDENVPEKSSKITWNKATCKQMMSNGVKTSTEAFETIFEMNTQLEKKLKRKNDEIKDLREENAVLTTKVKKMITDKSSQLEQINDYKNRNDQLEVEKKILISEIEAVTRRMARKQDDAVNEAKKQFLDNAKKMKFCVGCNATKPQDTIYACSDNCYKRHCEMMLN